MTAHARLAALSSRRRVALYNRAMVVYHIRARRFHAAIGTPGEARALDKLTRAMDRELRLAAQVLR